MKQAGMTQASKRFFIPITPGVEVNFGKWLPEPGSLLALLKV
jgi:hypothetical protein